MTPEVFTIVGVGIVLAGIILNGQRTQTARMDRLTDQLADLRERIAKLEGLIEGLREAVSGRRNTRTEAS